MNVFVLNTKQDILKNEETEQFWGTIDFHCIFFLTVEVNGAPKQPDYKLSSEYLPLCSAEQTHSNRVGTTWGWVNNDNNDLINNDLNNDFSFLGELSL